MKSRPWTPVATTIKSRLIALVAALVTVVAGFASFASAAHATTPSVTYNATVTIPAPPSSNFAGAGAGGDGWAVALSASQIFNVFHHQTSLMVMCHNQSDASACWTSYKTVTDGSGNGFSTSGQPGLYLDQTTHYLYVWATRASDSTAGVVCIDTQSASTNPFCGFTALSAVGQAPYSGFSGLSDPVMVGTHWYSFNDVWGPASGTENTLLCFDVSTDGACASQPYPVDFGGGSVTSGSPHDSIAVLGTKIVLQVPAPSELACFDTTTNSSCAGSWPVAITGGTAGAPLPMLTSTGAYAGVCLPTSSPSCWDMSGATAAAPAGLSSLTGNAIWNGPATVIGARIYFPNGGVNAAECYDYSTNASCANFPLVFSNLSLLYTVNPDPNRPTCLWVNADSGSSQIQNFDAYTGGTCANAPLRLLASSVVATNPVCVPASWTSLTVLSPSPGTYTSGTVTFDDADGNPIAGVATHNLDATGTTSLTDLNLSSTVPLPQFLVTLTGTTGSLGSVQIQVTWSGSYDPSCVQGATTVTTATSPSAPNSPTASAADSAATVSWTPPASDGYSPITSYTATAYDSTGTVAGTCTAPGSATSCVISPLTNGDPYTFTVTATNAIGSASSLASPAAVPTSPSITTTSVPPGDQGMAYDQPLAVTGGVGPYTWALSSTSASLPAGLSVTPAGHISGTPNTPGSANVTVEVTDANGATATQNLTVTVNSDPSILTTSVPGADFVTAYDQALAATGGTTPYTWALSGTSNSLPIGLGITPAGHITGIPTIPGSANVTVEVTDANGATATQNLTVTVNADPTVDATPPIPGDIGSTFDRALGVTGGTGPFTWQLTGGNLPPGLTLGSDGHVTGTPTTAGTYLATVEVTDAYGVTHSAQVPMVVNTDPTIDATPPVAGDIAVAYDRALGVTGGTGPFTWQLTAGTLPPGLNLGADGHVTGTPTTAGTYLATVKVTDTNGQTDTRQIPLVVNPVTTVPAVPVNATPAGTPVTQQLVPQGGTGPFVWTLASGNLPPGVTLNPDGTFAGTSTSPGTYTFTVEVTDTNGQTALQTVTVTVQPSDLNTRPIAATPDAKGYWVANPNGAVVPFGDAKSYGSMAATPLAAPIKGIAATNDGKGYWLVGSDGGVFALGDAHFYGSAVGTHLGGAILGLTPTPDGKGYWLVGSDGGVFAFGDAGFYGSAAGLAKHGTVQSLAVTPDAHGYWLVGTDGGVFAFGDARFYGSAANIHLAGPVTGIAATNDGKGYWLVGTDGGVFAFGDAHFYGSLSRIPMNGPASGIIGSPDSRGYWLVANDGGVFAFGSSKFMGSIPGWTPPAA